MAIAIIWQLPWKARFRGLFFSTKILAFSLFSQFFFMHILIIVPGCVCWMQFCNARWFLGLLLRVNSINCTCDNFQADVETDKVYAQMTLQPLTSSIMLFFKELIVYVINLYDSATELSFLSFDVARAERYISSYGIWHS